MTWSEATIGIVIGSLFTTLGVILQGCISWWLEGRKYSLAQHVDQNTLNTIDEMLGGVVQQMNRELVKAYSEGR